VALKSTYTSEEKGAEIEEALDALDLLVDRLKVLYEQYFMGIERVEPQVARKDIQRTLLQLQQTYIRNTSLRFKFNTMLQKWNIYITYWNRVLREIENGTYVKHLQKAKRKAEREGRELPAEMGFNRIRHQSGGYQLSEEDSGSSFLDIDTSAGKKPAAVADDFNLEEVWDRIAPSESKPNPLSAKPAAPKAPPAPPVAAAKPPQPPLPPPLPPGTAPKKAAMPPAATKPTTAMPRIPGMNEQDLRALHQRYVDAQKQSGGATAVKYETLVSSLAKQVPSVLSRPGVKGVRFDVTVENGRPVLKAIPQK